MYTVFFLRVCLKRVPYLISDGREPPCGCWELNSRPSEEQAMLLTAEPSLQHPPIEFILIVCFFLGGAAGDTTCTRFRQLVKTFIYILYN